MLPGAPGVVAVVSPGAMGSAIAAAYAAGGARAVVTVAGRSDRTRSLARRDGIELLPDLDAVVAAADVVLSVVPPGEARATADAILAAAARTGSRPLVADLNAVSPATAGEVAALVEAAGLDFVDGSISGGPPRPGGRTLVYLSGRRAADLAALAAPGIEPRVVGEAPGVASAVKMCTASVYKGTTALLAHALLTAEAHGVLEQVLDDLAAGVPSLVERAPRGIAVAATKAARFVDEMHEIAATQAAAGLPRELFDGVAAAYAALAATELAGRAPEDVEREPPLAEVLERAAR